MEKFLLICSGRWHSHCRDNTTEKTTGRREVSLQNPPDYIPSMAQVPERDESQPLLFSGDFLLFFTQDPVTTKTCSAGSALPTVFIRSHMHYWFHKYLFQCPPSNADFSSWEKELGPVFWSKSQKGWMTTVEFRCTTWLFCPRDCAQSPQFS